MSNTTDELRYENHHITKIINDAKRFSMRTLLGRQTLFDNKFVILSHLKKEDKKIHTTLLNEVKYHPDLKECIDIVQNEVEGITNYVTEFFLKYNLSSVSKELNDDFEIIYNKLTNRIENEENKLYLGYEAIEEIEEKLKKMIL